MFSKIFVDTLIKKKQKNFLIYQEIQMEAVAKSYIRKDFLINEEGLPNI
jgi:hypothetical protein